MLNGNKLPIHAALEAAKRWRFQLGSPERKAVLDFFFRILPKETPAEDFSTIFTPRFQSKSEERYQSRRITGKPGVLAEQFEVAIARNAGSREIALDDEYREFVFGNHDRFTPGFREHHVIAGQSFGMRQRERKGYTPHTDELGAGDRPHGLFQVPKRLFLVGAT